MGLSERRAFEEYKGKKLPEWMSKINSIVGYEIPFEIMWETLAPQIEGRQPASENVAEYMDKMFFATIEGALISICADKMGKDALHAALKNIKLQCTADFYDERGFSFESGILTLDLRYANVDYVSDRVSKLQELLEKKL